MNKNEAKQAIDNLKTDFDKRMAELQAVIDTPESANPYVDKTRVGEQCYCIYPNSRGEWVIDSAVEKEGSVSVHVFISGHRAAAWANAHNTLDELRMCDGVKGFEIDVKNYFVDYVAGESTVRADFVDSYASQISPYFAAIEQAKAAIDKIGKKRLIAMFKTFAGMDV